MSKDQRKLTAAEEKRLAQFRRLSAAMEQAGYVRHEQTISLVQANWKALLTMTPFALLIAVPFLMIHPGRTLSFWQLLVFSVLTLVLTVIHELLHGLTWGSFAPSRFQAISFGIIWCYLTPYCNCAEPLRKMQYLLGAAMPTLILGFLLGTVSICIGSMLLMLLSVVMIYGGGADFIVIGKILRCRTTKKQVLYYDHPSECGFVVFEKD